MNEVVEVLDIAVCYGGTLHSLREQKVAKSGSLESFEGGSGILKEGKLYVLEEVGDLDIISEVVAESIL